MSNTIHGASHKIIKYMRKQPAALAVYWIYISRTNNENVAWPSLRGLAKDTGWNKTTCQKARDWLVSVKAIELVRGYVRPDWRDLPEADKAKRVGLDKTEYYRPTGLMVLDGVIHPVLYFGKNESSDIEEEAADDYTHDVPPRRTSTEETAEAQAENGRCPTPQTIYGVDRLPDGTELSTNGAELDSNKDLAPAIADAEPEVVNPEPTPVEKPAAKKSAKRKSSTRPTVPREQLNPMADAIVESFEWSWERMTEFEKSNTRGAARQLCLAGRKPEHVQIIHNHVKRLGWKGIKPTTLASAASDALKHLRNDDIPTVAPPTQEEIERNTDSSKFIRYDADGNFEGFGRKDAA